MEQPSRLDLVPKDDWLTKDGVTTEGGRGSPLHTTVASQNQRVQLAPFPSCERSPGMAPPPSYASGWSEPPGPMNPTRKPACAARLGLPWWREGVNSGNAKEPMGPLVSHGRGIRGSAGCATAPAIKGLLPLGPDSVV